MNLRIWERLPPAWWATPRARMGWAIGGGVGLFVLPLALEIVNWVRASHNTDIATALATVQAARADLAQQKQRSEGIAQRYAQKAPALASFMEQQAKKAGTTLPDSTDRAEVPVGKLYVERQNVAHMKKTGLLPLVLFLEGVEQSGYPVSVQRLNVRKREADSYDVEVGVTAYDRVASAPKDKTTETP